MNHRGLLTAAVLGLLGACSPQGAGKPPEASAVAAAPSAPVSPPADASAAQAPAAAGSQSVGEGPPLVNGVYVVKGACPGEGCYLSGKMRALEAMDLYDKPGAGAVVIGKIAAGEWIMGGDREDHVVPLRGIVREGRKHFATGDVVYLVTNDGEGCGDVWYKGQRVAWCDPDSAGSAAGDEQVAFDKPGPPPPGAGFWLETRREKGPSGWVRNIEKLECSGYQDRGPDCPPLPQ